MATTYTDTTVNNLVINKMTKDEYDALVNKSDTEIYLVEDEVDTTPTSGSDNYITSGGVYTALQDKADKVSNATSGNFASLDANGNLTDSGHKHSDYLTSHQDISGKADKVSNATNGNFAGLDSNGNLTDSGSKASDFLTQHQDISGKVNKTGDTMTGDLQFSGSSLYLRSVKTSIFASDASKLFFGTPENPKVFMSANSNGAFGIYDASQEGITCYPATGIIPQSPIDFGREANGGLAAKYWKNLYANGSLYASSSLHETFANILTKLGYIPASLGTAGQVLTMNSGATAPEWADVPKELPAYGSAEEKMFLAVKSDHSDVEWTTIPTELPSLTGNANKILAVNSGATGVEWITNSGGGGGLTDYDFTELSAPTIDPNDGTTTITFAANQRNCVEVSTNADLAIALVSNNKADNYIWITNSHLTDDIDVTFSSITFGSTTINDVVGTDSIPTIAHGETLEIGVYVNSSKARITSRIL